MRLTLTCQKGKPVRISHNHALKIAIALCFALLPAVASAQDWFCPQDSEPYTQLSPHPLSGDGLQLTSYASGFWRPHTVAYASDGSKRILVVEQAGRIWLIDDGGFRLVEPFLDISHLISPGRFHWSDRPELGLLGIALHPHYGHNGYFYVNYTDHEQNTRIVRYTRGDAHWRADPDSAIEILSIQQPFYVHNGGSMAFGPDGYLYISVGDGGWADDPLGSGQDRGTLLGSVLRIDVDREAPYAIPPDNPFVDDPQARGEIWAHGLRNVWGLSFDSLTGDLYMADVGQYHREELNFQPADSPGGENYGWNAYEGTHNRAGGDAPDSVPPIFEYNHNCGCAIMGGHVYRGEDISELQGVYISGDLCSGVIWGTWRDETGAWRTTELLQSNIEQLSGFGVGRDGEIYVVDYAGKVYRLDAASSE